MAKMATVKGKRAEGMLLSHQRGEGGREEKCGKQKGNEC